MTPDLKLLETILSKVHPNCISDVCEDEGCSLLLEGLVATEYALLSMDGPHSPVLVGMAKCDFLFFGWIPGSDWFCVSPIELTMGIHKSSTDILDQLRAGANLVEDLVPEGPRNSTRSRRCRPVREVSTVGVQKARKQYLVSRSSVLCESG